MTRKELEKFFEKNYGYKKTSVWNINGLTVDAENIDEEVVKQLDRELKGRRYGKSCFICPVIITKRSENYFIKVELESVKIRSSDVYGKEIPEEDGEQGYWLVCNIEGYWMNNNEICIILKDDFTNDTHGFGYSCKWEEYDFKDLVNILNEIIDDYFIQEVLIKVIKNNLFK